MNKLVPIQEENKDAPTLEKSSYLAVILHTHTHKTL